MLMEGMVEMEFDFVNRKGIAIFEEAALPDMLTIISYFEDLSSDTVQRIEVYRYRVLQRVYERVGGAWR